jgi:hypothetical protein
MIGQAARDRGTREIQALGDQLLVDLGHGVGRCWRLLVAGVRGDDSSQSLLRKVMQQNKQLSYKIEYKGLLNTN